MQGERLKKKTQKKRQAIKKGRKEPKFDLELLERLVNVVGVSGQEEEVRAIISKEIKKYVDRVYVDKMGNLVGHKKGSKPRVMLAAHMDEIGLMIKSINDYGLISFSTVGYVEPSNLLGWRVRISTPKGSLQGVITTKELSEDMRIKSVPRIEDLFVDTGLKKKELAERGVKIGDYIDFEQRHTYSENDGVIFGKALDDRIGCFILIEVARGIKQIKNEVFFVFTVQEEVGLYGAKTSAYDIEPDWAIAVDVTNADDTTHEATKSIGKGPCITIKDADMIANKHLNKWLEEIAKKKSIPFQLDVSELGTTDALTISLSRGGVPATVVGVAVRNLHTTISIAHKQDIVFAIELLEEMMKRAEKITIV